MTHHHPDRIAEVYQLTDAAGANLRWIGYTVDPIPGAAWYPDLQGYVLPVGHDWKPDVRWAP